ncbi:winged helix-turn-helix domain-containing protein [Trinickia dinghuensis]|uniref:HTH HARE-type domain-containing protein n=1 Tax=Trinickia dinghuensis TaxID=2291023 RepID=A0A3D8K6E3_9BURK|nr:winged helix-turn-helix domain-containing protein [Trinickia dinghuensis]RDV00889.1 hypothetical protein DWV00_03915 [Trinickia dinghuensis]
MLTLHEAIVQVLSAAGEPMTAGAIAEEVRRLGLYSRRDGAPAPANQVNARVNRYSQLFGRNDGLISLRSESPMNQGLPRPPRQDPHTPVQGKHHFGDLESRRLAPISSVAFRDVGVIGVLLKTGLPSYDWLDCCGVYALILPPEYKLSFIDAEEAREAGNVRSPWDVDELRRKWVYGTRVVYIGLAGDRSPRSLRKRLMDLLNHCNGKTSEKGPHKGGEIIWQFAAYDSLLVRAVPTGSPPEPRDTKRSLLAEFRELHGALPFANRKL